MTANYNNGHCVICRKPGTDWRESASGVRVWLCDNHDCVIEAEKQLRDEYMEMRQQHGR